jgi:hypothetical protein
MGRSVNARRDTCPRRLDGSGRPILSRSTRVRLPPGTHHGRIVLLGRHGFHTADQVGSIPTPPTGSWCTGFFVLQVGQRIVSGSEEWVVTELLNQNNRTPRIRVRVEKAGPHMATYLTVGREYVLRQSSRLSPNTWVVPEKQCKRTSSQVILFDFEGGPSIEIDF